MKVWMMFFKGKPAADLLWEPNTHTHQCTLTYTHAHTNKQTLISATGQMVLSRKAVMSVVCCLKLFVGAGGFTGCVCVTMLKKHILERRGKVAKEDNHSFTRKSCSHSEFEGGSWLLPVSPSFHTRQLMNLLWVQQQSHRLSELMMSTVTLLCPHVVVCSRCSSDATSTFWLLCLVETAFKFKVTMSAESFHLSLALRCEDVDKTWLTHTYTHTRGCVLIESVIKAFYSLQSLSTDISYMCVCFWTTNAKNLS